MAIHKVNYLDSFIPGYRTGDYITPIGINEGKVIFRIVGLVPPTLNPDIYVGLVNITEDVLMEVTTISDRRMFGDSLNIDEFKSLIGNAGFWNHREFVDDRDYLLLEKVFDDYRPLTVSEKLLYTNE